VVTFKTSTLICGRHIGAHRSTVGSGSELSRACA
jgi:hypothetical protein